VPQSADLSVREVNQSATDTIHHRVNPRARHHVHTLSLLYSPRTQGMPTEAARSAKTSTRMPENTL